MTESPGFYRAVVQSKSDPMKRGRVLVAIPAISAEPQWATLCLPLGARSAVALPELGDEVIVGFTHGDLKSPFCLGYLWDGKQSPPEHK